jgi:hypothetical protein
MAGKPPGGTGDPAGDIGAPFTGTGSPSGTGGPFRDIGASSLGTGAPCQSCIHGHVGPMKRLDLETPSVTVLPSVHGDAHVAGSCCRIPALVSGHANLAGRLLAAPSADRPRHPRQAGSRTRRRRTVDVIPGRQAPRRAPCRTVVAIPAGRLQDAPADVPSISSSLAGPLRAAPRARCRAVNAHRAGTLRRTHDHGPWPNRAAKRTHERRSREASGASDHRRWGGAQAGT